MTLNPMVFVALGSNLGNSIDTINRAFIRLQTFSDTPLLRSCLWQSSPVDCPPASPLFVNAAAGFAARPGETPAALLHALRELEKFFGRQDKVVMNEPRVLDLDLIVFGSAVSTTENLTLPHPRAHLRRFVLQPLSEIAPDLIFPDQKKSVVQLLADLPPDPSLRKL